MRIKKAYLLLSIICSTIIAFFTTCKKYPEDTLWFKNPKKIAVIHGNITEYIVNGIDSLQYLDGYYTTNTVGVTPPYAPYTNSNKDIHNEDFSSALNGFNGAIKSDLGSGNYILDKKKKKINIFFIADNPLYFKKNIFIAKEAIDWTIQYLDKDGKKSKIKTTYNGNTYEITFEN